MLGVWVVIGGLFLDDESGGWGCGGWVLLFRESVIGGVFFYVDWCLVGVVWGVFGGDDFGVL